MPAHTLPAPIAGGENAVALPDARSEDDALKEALELEFPDWAIWRSSSGVWYATRRGSPLTDAEMFAGLHHTVFAEDADVLRKEIRKQDAIEVDLVPRRTFGE